MEPLDLQHLPVWLLIVYVSANSDGEGTAYAAVQKQDGAATLIIYLKKILKPAI